MPAILAKGRTAMRDALKTLISHVGVSTDTTAFADGQTTIDPSGTATTVIKTSTEVNVDGSTFDATMTVDGTADTTLQGKFINTVGVLNGPANTDVLTRTVRSVGIGVQVGDVFQVGVRAAVQDNSP